MADEVSETYMFKSVEVVFEATPTKLKDSEVSNTRPFITTEESVMDKNVGRYFFIYMQFNSKYSIKYFQHRLTTSNDFNYCLESNE